jgi:PDZ domain-containing protein
VLLRKIFNFAFILFIIISLGFLIQTDYYLIKPGSVDELGNLIQVEGEVRKEEGQFFMVTVTQHPANLWNYLYGIWHPFLDVRPISKVIPPDMSQEEYNKLMQSWMQESKYLAQIIALRRAGYEVPIVSDGVEIVELMAGSPAEGILKAGDIIKAVEGKKVNLVEEVVEYIQQKEVGQKVRITIQQGEKIKEFEVLTTSHQEEPRKAALGIYVRTLNWQPLLPLKIDIDTGPVIGPSAGMMFVLEILDRLLPENLTGGRLVAGTGTISIDGKVGGIGGVKQKVIAAERAGIDYFLVPAENYEDARQAAGRINVVSVRNLDEALGFLQSLNTACQYYTTTTLEWTIMKPVPTPDGIAT